MGNYRQLTIQILDLCGEGRELLYACDELNKRLHSKVTPEERNALIGNVASRATIWNTKCRDLLCDNGLEIERVKFLQTSASPFVQAGYNMKLSGTRGVVSARVDLLTRVAEGIENQKAGKELVSITLDDLDNFAEVRAVSASDVIDFAKSAFLEDDVEEQFLAAIGEPYKELDSGAETRDLFTNRLCFQGRRLSTAIMFKGRGLKGPLSLRDCGAKGSQLLKLAKNNAAECFIVQHVNKIEPDVKETLIDLVLMNTRHTTVYVGFIDGVDTASFLKSRGKDLTDLSSKRTVR